MDIAATTASTGTDQLYADRMKTIEDIARRVGDLSVAFAGISGDIEDTASQVSVQSELFKQIAGRAEDMNDRTNTVLTAAHEATGVADIAETKARETGDKVQAMVDDVTHLIGDVTAVGERLSRLEEALNRVARVSSEVDSISRKTNLLSLNAAIEAARAGKHGRGFMVVAREVKDLSHMTTEATAEIRETVETLGKELQGLMQQAGGAVEKANVIRSETDGIGSAIEELPRVMASVSHAQRDITKASNEISVALGGVRDDIKDLSDGVTRSSASLSSAGSQMRTIIESSEALVGMTARLDVETVDTPYIQAVKAAAAEVSRLFEEAVDKHEISMRDLFDQDYKEIMGSNPKQFATRYNRVLDRILPKIQEPMLMLSNRVVFCAAVDTKGYLPTHNRKFSQPQQAGNPEWNAANSRNRRIFNDRVGLGAGQSTRPFLLQAYRRDMGNGEFKLMKDVSAPIKVHGKHWGGLRLAYTV